MVSTVNATQFTNPSPDFALLPEVISLSLVPLRLTLLLYEDAVFRRVEAVEKEREENAKDLEEERRAAEEEAQVLPQQRA